MRLPCDPRTIICKYIKFYRGKALFGIIDMNNPIDMKVIDFYYLTSDEYIMVDGEKEPAIDLERTGILIKSYKN